MAEPKTSTNRTQEYAESIGIAPVSLSIARIVVHLCVLDRHVPLLIAESSVGKTAMLQQFATANKVPFKFYGLANKEASDLTGPMMPSSDGRTFQHLPPSDIPIMGLANQDDFLVEDLAEINRADQSTLNAAMQLYTDRMLGTHKLGPNVFLVADMNPPDGAYAVTSSFSSDPAMRRRTCQIAVNFSANEFLRWAKDPTCTDDLVLPALRDAVEPPDTHKYRPLHPSVIEFLQSDVGRAMDHQARDSGKVYGCPAAWHACSDTLYTVERLELNVADPRLGLALQVKMAGHVGTNSAQALLEYHNRAAAALDPRDMLLHFADKNCKSRKQVAALLEGGHAARVAGALNNLAVIWAEGVDAKDFTSEQCAPNLAHIFKMIPLDVGGALLQAIVEADTQGGGGPTEKSTGLVRLLHKEPAFISFRDARADSLRQKQAAEIAAGEEAGSF